MKKNKNGTEENTNERKPLLHADHPRPVTRRDFLSTGLLGMSAVAFASPLMTMISGSAWAQANCAGAAAMMQANIPFLCIDAAGGMNIAGGNVIVGQGASSEQEDFHSNYASYIRLGIPMANHPKNGGQINKLYGLKFHSTSGILAGMDSVLNQRSEDEVDIRTKVDGLLICGITSDDSQANPLNTSYIAQKAGAIGGLVQLAAHRDSVSGGNSVAPPEFINLSLKPSNLSGFEASSGLLSIGSNTMSANFLNSSASGGDGRLKRFIEQLSRASESSKRSIAAQNKFLNEEISKFNVRQGGLGGVFDKYAPSALNPMSNAEFGARIAKVHGKLLTQINGMEQTSANINNLLVERIAGAATLTLGGADYHTGNATTGDAFDKEIGKNIGWAIRAAHEKKVPFFIHLFTDGGVGGDNGGQIDSQLPGRVVWAGDRGESSAALIIVYNPNKTRSSSGSDETSNFMVKGRTRQIGWFNSNAGVNAGSHSLANNASKLWQIILLNYLATKVDSNDDDEVIANALETFRCRFGDTPPDAESLIRLNSLCHKAS